MTRAKRQASTVIGPARTLADVIYVFNPHKPLDGPEPHPFYMDRGSLARRDMRTLLEVTDLARREPIKLLFTGHTGSGKSTELNKLCEDLDDRFFVVRVSMRTLVQPTDLTYVDLVLIGAMALFRAATEQRVINKAMAGLVGELWGDIAGFIESQVFGNLPYRKPAGDTEVGAKVGYLVAEFEVKYKNEAVSREQIRRHMEDRLSEIIDRTNRLAALVRARTRRPVLFVYEDTDKPDPARGRQIFFDHPTTLTAFNASVIYTFNIALWYERQFSTIKPYFHRHFLLPNLKLKERTDRWRDVTGPSDAAGWAQLDEVLARRLIPTLITAEARHTLIKMSGGLLRSLIGMTQFAAVNALGRGAERIERSDVERAVRELRNDFVAALQEKDYAVLAARQDDNHLSSDPEVQELLQMLALLQYENSDGAWCDVHPAVEELLEERHQS